MAESTWGPTPPAVAASNEAIMREKSAKPALLNDLWHRVDGSWIDDGSESYAGMELSWTTWRCVRLTRCGAWFQRCEWPHNAKPRFVLTLGARNLHRTKREALEALIRRKRRHLAILEGQKTAAEDTLQAARDDLAAMKAAT